MAEPSAATTVIVTAGGAGLASALLGLDGNAVLGAFAGAALMALSAKDVGVIARVVYLLVSGVMGYIAAPELMKHMPLQESGVAAFVAASLVVTVTLQLIERVKTLDLTVWFRRGGGP